MCYAIPGRIVSIDDAIATIDYFGEFRKAKIISGDPKPETGDYVYAQGGLVVGKISKGEALPILKTWEKQFFELKKADKLLTPHIKQLGVLAPIIGKAERGEILTNDEMLAVLETKDKNELKTLFSAANNIRKQKLDNACCVHGILEFSNYCQNDCHYCGIRCSNHTLNRYGMSEDQILDRVDYAVEKLGFKALVLQSGEDQKNYPDDVLVSIIKKIRDRYGILLFMSVGERTKECYKRMYAAGAYGALLRFESSNDEIYTKLRPGKNRSARLQLIRDLQEKGFVLATGFLIGLPGQTNQDLIDDILLTKSLMPDMYSFGPLIPHPSTPLANSKKSSLDGVLSVIALCRLVDPEAKILVTTALETLAPNATEKGLLAGGNSLMINTTPKEFRISYDLYPGKAKEEPIVETIKRTVGLLHSLGRAPTDLGYNHGGE